MERSWKLCPRLGSAWPMLGKHLVRREEMNGQHQTGLSSWLERSQEAWDDMALPWQPRPRYKKLRLWMWIA